jgi:hypothetical protein
VSRVKFATRKYKTLFTLFFGMLVVLLLLACDGRPTGSKATSEGGSRLVLEPSSSSSGKNEHGVADRIKGSMPLGDASAPANASWKDVGRRFQELEKERAEMLKAMQLKAGASAPGSP